MQTTAPEPGPAGPLDNIAEDAAKLLRYLKSDNKDVQTILYFSLFLCVFPFVAFFGYLLAGIIIISLPLVLMFCCGVLCFRAAKAIEGGRYL
ncbi:hypothetical protein [Pseudomonas sp. LB3P14]